MSINGNSLCPCRPQFINNLQQILIMHQIEIHILPCCAFLGAVINGNHNSRPLYSGAARKQHNILSHFLAVLFTGAITNIIQLILQGLIFTLQLLYSFRQNLYTLQGFIILNVLCSAKLYRQHKAQNHTDTGYG